RAALARAHGRRAAARRAPVARADRRSARGAARRAALGVPRLSLAGQRARAAQQGRARGDAGARGPLHRRALGHRRGAARRALSVSRSQGGGDRELRAHVSEGAPRAGARQHLGGGAHRGDGSRAPDAAGAEASAREAMRALVVALTLLCAAGVARADATAEARAHYKEGLALFNEGRFVAARAAFEAGYQLQPLPLFLFNAAQAARRADDAAGALALYRKFVAAD